MCPIIRNKFCVLIRRSRYGTVSIAIQGSTIPGADNDVAVTSASQRRDGYYPRSSQEFVDSAFTSEKRIFRSFSTYYSYI